MRDVVLQFMYPLLYGVYLSLGLLALQPYQHSGFSSLGAACLLVLGSGLSVFLLSLEQLRDSPRLEWGALGRIAAAAAVQVIGLCSLSMGLLAGTGFYFAVMAIVYGTIAGLVWSRFLRSRPASRWSQLGVVVASVAVVMATLVDLGQTLAPRQSVPLLNPGDIMARALCLAGAVLWSVGHYAFDPRAFPAPRALWNLYQSVFSVGFVLVIGATQWALRLPADVMAGGFSQNPIVVVPFLLFGVVFGILRARLVHAWESRLSARSVQFWWVLGVVIVAVASALWLYRPAQALPEALVVAAMALCLFLVRHDDLGVSDYRGLQRVSMASLSR